MSSTTARTSNGSSSRRRHRQQRQQLASLRVLVQPIVFFLVFWCNFATQSSTTTTTTTIHAFAPLLHTRKSPTRHDGRKSVTQLKASSSSTTTTAATTTTTTTKSTNNNSLDVVLFGVGDLRVHDHGGLIRALSKNKQQTTKNDKNKNNSNNKILPLVILDYEETLPNIPGALCHTIDTASMLADAIQSLEEELWNQHKLKLHVQRGLSTVSSSLANVLQQISSNTNGSGSGSGSSSENNHEDTTSVWDDVTVHVCDLGNADNDMGYGYLKYLQQQQQQQQSQQDDSSSPSNDNNESLSLGPWNIKIETWDCHLRTTPWEEAGTSKFDTQYPNYAKHYAAGPVQSCLKEEKETTSNNNNNNVDVIVDDHIHIPDLASSSLPLSPIDVLALLEHALHLDQANSRAVTRKQELEVATGLFGTHWGDVGGSMGEKFVQQGIREYCDICGEDDATFFQTSPWYQSMRQTFNPKSLEHASLKWMMKSGSSSRSSSSSTTGTTTTDTDDNEDNNIGWIPNHKNLIAGEVMTRFLAAPLLFGTISPRYIWHAAEQAKVYHRGQRKDNNLLGVGGKLLSFLEPPNKPTMLQEMVESREWHKILAAHNIRSDPAYSSNTASSAAGAAGDIRYGYWRWNGFLCRYAESTLSTARGSEPSSSSSSLSSSTTVAATTTDETKDGIVFLHGFGASGSQWKQNLAELSQCLADGNNRVCDTTPSLQLLKSSNNKRDGSMDDGDEQQQQQQQQHDSTSTATTTILGLAPDLIGFGQAEKPALTYTQYLWESYALEFVKEVGRYKLGVDNYILGGNSIGGYTSMSAAADDSIQDNDDDYDKHQKEIKKKKSGNDNVLKVTGSGAPGTGKCVGVVLMNSAGRIQTRQEIDQIISSSSGDSSTTGLTTVAEMTASNNLLQLSAPPRFVANLFGKGLLAYLRPQIQSICQNLYPTNPGAVNNVLCDGILRDSLDPGAINVMISGSKLPPPRTANELLGADYGSAKQIYKVAINDDNEDEIATDSDTTKSVETYRYRDARRTAVVVEEGMWEGPVLVSQGMLDPLNDAKGRAAMLGDLRQGISVAPINAGHCPHDELPADVAKSIAEWMMASPSPSSSTDSATTTEKKEELVSSMP